ncbi:M20 family metallopeptidase [Cohnella sp.]|uniref:M20 family metallopeptidase n=1 Tax=Cohnella sp. TaxID=1883426 RepID=UPI0035615414
MSRRAVELLEKLIAIQSVNPHYGEEAQGEMAISRFIEAYCLQAGLRVTRQQVLDGRDNLIVELRSGHPESVLLFEAHMDTVSLGSMPRPLEPVRRDGKLYGRGACDTKGSLAAMIVALEECAAEPERLSSDLVLCASVDEEHAFRGLLKFLELDLPVAGAVVGEPTEMKIVVAHKGCVRFAVHTFGRAAHSSVPHEGENAIVAMAEIVRHISERMAPGLADIRDPLCGAATVSIGTIQGGEQINIVPERCTIRVDRRIVPGEDPEEVMAGIERELEAFCAGQGIRAEVERLLLDYALATPHDAGIVGAARAAAERLGLPGGLYGETYGSDASKLQGIKGIPSIVYGPGSIDQAHSPEEWVLVSEVEEATRFYVELARSFRA